MMNIVKDMFDNVFTQYTVLVVLFASQWYLCSNMLCYYIMQRYAASTTEVMCIPQIETEVCANTPDTRICADVFFANYNSVFSTFPLLDNDVKVLHRVDVYCETKIGEKYLICCTINSANQCAKLYAWWMVQQHYRCNLNHTGTLGDLYLSPNHMSGEAVFNNHYYGKNQQNIFALFTNANQDALSCGAQTVKLPAQVSFTFEPVVNNSCSRDSLLLQLITSVKSFVSKAQQQQQ